MKSVCMIIALITILLFGTPSGILGGDEEKMDLSDLAWVVELPRGFDDAVKQVTAALTTEGFGVVARIDLHTSFKKKLDVEMKPHTILKVCNPKLAHKAVTALPEVSLLLPCSVTVQSVGENLTIVRIGNPQTIMSDAGVDANPVVREVGDTANQQLKRVAQVLGTPVEIE
ncbi:MAG: DUF302 domain-containing protein [Candidatus Latescibacterota bacterium]|nr:MAG: DUF302 domain-containing protein [Candidatus Latescibacterota bacterium]